MSTSDPPFLYPTRLDIPLEIRTYVIVLLNQTLGCTVELRSNVKQASWNVKGKESSHLRALFDAIATELEAYADLLAERIAVLGGVALGTLRTVAVQSTLPEYPSHIMDGTAHVLVLAEYLASYAKMVRSSIAPVTNVEDAVTAHIYTEIARGIDKRLWCLETYLYEGGHRQSDAEA